MTGTNLDKQTGRPEEAGRHCEGEKAGLAENLSKPGTSHVYTKLVDYGGGVGR